MAPQLIPEDPRFTTESERVVWERLRDSLRGEDTLIANYRLTDSRKDHEADLVLVMPDVGVVVVEVKGSGARVTDGRWSILRHGRRVGIHPVDQARDTKYAVRATSSPTGAGRTAPAVRSAMRTRSSPPSSRSDSTSTCPTARAG